MRVSMIALRPSGVGGEAPPIDGASCDGAKLRLRLVALRRASSPGPGRQDCDELGDAGEQRSRGRGASLAGLPAVGEGVLAAAHAASPPGVDEDVDVRPFQRRPECAGGEPGDAADPRCEDTKPLRAVRVEWLTIESEVALARH